MPPSLYNQRYSSMISDCSRCSPYSYIYIQLQLVQNGPLDNAFHVCLWAKWKVWTKTTQTFSAIAKKKKIRLKEIKFISTTEKSIATFYLTATYYKVSKISLPDSTDSLCNQKPFKLKRNWRTPTSQTKN